MEMIWANLSTGKGDGVQKEVLYCGERGRRDGARRLFARKQQIVHLALLCFTLPHATRLPILFTFHATSTFVFGSYGRLDSTVFQDPPELDTLYRLLLYRTSIVSWYQVHHGSKSHFEHLGT